ncbi:MAG: hypothetical protein KIS73_27040 [Enhydrobacter sp.]|nr:hypothetical protein [Enhydrobacter sp.]
MRDANSARQNKRLEQIQRTYDREDDEAMRAVMATETGRQVLMRLARRCRWLGDPWDANSVRLTDYESGRRAAGLDLMAWAERVDSDAFMAMQREAQARDKAAAEVRQAALITEEDDDG